MMLSIISLPAREEAGIDCCLFTVAVTMKTTAKIQFQLIRYSLNAQKDKKQ